MKNIAIIILILTVSTFSQTLTLSEMKSAFRYNEEGVTKVFDEKLLVEGECEARPSPAAKKYQENIKALP